MSGRTVICCLVCGKQEADEDRVSRKIDVESNWYQEILKQVLGQDFNEFQSFCKICDRLITEFDEVSKEKKSLKSEIEFRLANQNNSDYDDDDYDDALGIDETADDEEVADDKSRDTQIEKGEIEDVSKFMKDNVKIFEIDVKQQENEEVPEESQIVHEQEKEIVKLDKPVRKKEVVITKFDQSKAVASNKIFVDTDQKTWENIVENHALTKFWEVIVSCLLQPHFPDCLIKLELQHFKSNDQEFYFCASGFCDQEQCPLKFVLESEKRLNFCITPDGEPNHNSRIELHKILPIEDENSLHINEDDFNPETVTKDVDPNLQLVKTEEFLCPECGELFSSVHERNIHHSNVHGNFKCERCKKSFQSEARLNIHIKHCNSEDNFQCQFCLKTFANKRNLRDHINVLHKVETNQPSSAKNKFECQHCGKVFYKKFNLTSHLLRHSNVTPFLCDVPNCGKGFKREKTLLKHYQVIHEGRKERYLCGQCGQQFTSQSGFRTHLALHTGQEYIKRNVKCNICDKMFRCPSDLKTHLVVHSKEKPFLCTWPDCGHSFSQKASLKDHLNVHEKKYECHNCKKSFGRERYLVMHMKTCIKLSKDDQNNEVSDNTDEAVENVNVQHIIITTDDAEIDADLSNAEVEMTEMHVVQSETGELAVMLVEQEEMEEDNIIHVVTQ